MPHLACGLPPCPTPAAVAFHTSPLISATSPPPRRSRKGGRDAAQRSPLIHPFPRIDGRPSSSPPHAHTHTVGVHAWNSEARVRKLQGAQHGAQHALSCLIGQHVRMQLGAQKLNRSVLPHLSGLIGQPLIDGSSRELTGAHGSSRELTGAHGSSRELTGAHGSSRELIDGSSRELRGLSPRR